MSLLPVPTATGDGEPTAPRARARRRMTLTVGFLTAAALLAPGVSASARVAPDTVGGSRSSTTAKVGTAGSSAVAVQATLACNPAEAFSRTESGLLYRLVDSDPAGGQATMSETGQIGSGWKPSAYAWISGGGDGVIYALKWNGDIVWFRRVNGGWASGQAKLIGTGFVPRTKVLNIGLGANGAFYIVRPDGSLYIYKHLARLTGEAKWLSNAGTRIGTGWTGSEIIAPTGDGTIYRQYRGNLFWYRHSDPAAGAVTWSKRTTIGTGWNFYDVLSAGGGVLYATSGGDGRVMVYKHNDPIGGANLWASATGIQKTTVRLDSYGITIDPNACSLN